MTGLLLISQQSNAKKNEDDSEAWFKVLTVTVVTDGVDTEVSTFPLPDRYEIQQLVYRKLAHIDDSGITFGLAWSFEQVCL